MNKRIKKKQIKMNYKRICKRYPFLIIRNWKTDKPIEYPYTYLDDMPYGWKQAFGKQMCEEVRSVLIKGRYLYNYRVAQVKEKYGGLRWYDEGAPSSIYHELQDIIDKYEELSYHTCICCGRPATKFSKSWISPFCDRCAGKLSDRVQFKEMEKIKWK